MTKTYKFNYNEGDYVLMYSNPNEKDNPFSISEDTMQFDTKHFYEYVFQDVKEKLDLKIVNEMDENVLDPKVYKKGLRVYKTIEELCDQITKEINKKCFE